MAELPDVTDETFARDVLSSTTPVLVDFWGDHCPACIQIAPVLKQLAGEYAGRVSIVKVHAADNPSTAGKLGIRAMPTVLAFAKGQVVGQLVGARRRADFAELIERALGAS